MNKIQKTKLFLLAKVHIFIFALFTLESVPAFISGGGGLIQI